MIKYVLTAFLLLGCATETKEKVSKKQRYKNVNLKALKFVKKFERILRQDISDVKVRFVKFKKTNAAGMCNMSTGIIYLNKERWDSFSEITKETVVFHELGHCVLGRGHLYYDDKKYYCAPSIMGWRGIEDDCYTQMYAYYINELFTGCRKFY